MFSQYEDKAEEIRQVRQALPTFSGDDDVIEETEEQYRQELENKKKDKKSKLFSVPKKKQETQQKVKAISIEEAKIKKRKSKSEKKRKRKQAALVKFMPPCVAGNKCSPNFHNVTCQHCGGNVLYAGEACESIDPNRNYIVRGLEAPPLEEHKPCYQPKNITKKMDGETQGETNCEVHQYKVRHCHLTVALTPLGLNTDK